MKPEGKLKPTYAFDFVESETLMPLLDQAKKENRLIFIDFYTTWCLPCRMLEEEVFTDQNLGGFINEHFISYRVDAEKGNGVNLATIFEVKVYPTLLFLDARGRILNREEGAVSPSVFRELAEQAMLADQ